MAEFDLILRNGSLVLEAGVARADIAIAQENVVAIRSCVFGSTAVEIDCSALHVFPGVIDSHVHFNEPGRTDWEGIASGSKAVAAGGGTCFVDMPLNSHPPVLDGPAFDAKRSAAEAQSVTDFALWGGLTPLNLDRMEELRDRGVIGFKAFMSNSGIAEFPRADERVLREGMKRAAALDVPVAVHAESEEITAALTGAAKSNAARAYLDSRPIRAECEAISVALDLAGETRCALHIVHVSSAEGLALIARAKSQGIDVTSETCPHYLVLSEDEMIALGGVAKCAPPLRAKAERKALRDALFSGGVDTLASDHSPAPYSMKTGDDFFAIWGGISGAQHLLPLMLDLWLQRGSDDWPLLGRLLSANVASRFRLPLTFGRIAVGAEANLALVDLEAEETIDVARLHYRHRITPYSGKRIHGRVVRTLLRGQTIAQDGQYIGQAPTGRLIQPRHQ